MADAAYTQFMKAPNPSLLASSATINYITTNTAISEPAAIIKHLNAQAKQVAKLNQKTIHAIESQDGLSVCLELEVSMRFENGGGVYLPKLDENLLDEKEVTLAMNHMVQLDPDGKISQIRIYWDQGSLLKMVDAIGKTGRNWPIQDGKAYTNLMTKSVKAAGQGDGTNTGTTLPLRGAAQNFKDGHKRESISATRDPHASLDLFQRRESDASSYTGPKFVPRESAKPAAREYGELFGGEQEAGSKIRSPSPSKQDGVFKGGAGKNYKGNRIFDENEAASPPPARKKTYNQKYDHFAFGDGEDAPSTDASRPSTSRSNAQTMETQIDFESFSTPPKFKQKPQKEHERHWGPGVDEDDPESPPKRPVVHAPRKDADPHFAFTDSPQTPAEAPKAHHHRTAGKGLYVDHITGNDPHSSDDETPRKNPITNVTNTRRADNNTAHYSLTDAQATPAGAKEKNGKLGEKGQYKNIYKTAGDGMGGRKGAGRSWGFGDESEPEEEVVRPTARSRRAQAEAGAVRDW